MSVRDHFAFRGFMLCAMGAWTGNAVAQPASQQRTSAPGSVSVPGPMVAVRTIEPDPVHGRLVSFSLEDGLVMRTDLGERRIPTADLVRISWSAASAAAGTEVDAGAAPREHVTLTLAWGDVVSGRVADPRDDAVVLSTMDLGEIAVPLDAVARLTSSAAAGPAYRESVEWFLRTQSAEEDAILLTNGDVLRGFVTRIDAEGVTIDGAAGPVSVPQRLALAVQVAHPPPTSPPALHAVIHLRDSGRVTVTSLNYDGKTVRGRTHAGPAVQLSADRVVAVDVAGGRWVWLTELRPVSYEQVPMLSLGWDYQTDRNVAGGKLTVAKQTFDRGIGVHSRSVLIYELDAAYREFVTSFGMDDDSGPLAAVNVAILVDGQKRYEKSHVRRGALLGPVRLDVARAGRIELLVDFGENGDVQDRLDWIEPALIR